MLAPSDGASTKCPSYFGPKRGKATNQKRAVGEAEHVAGSRCKAEHQMTRLLHFRDRLAAAEQKHALLEAQDFETWRRLEVVCRCLQWTGVVQSGCNKGSPVAATVSAIVPQVGLSDEQGFATEREDDSNGTGQHGRWGGVENNYFACMPYLTDIQAGFREAVT